MGLPKDLIYTFNYYQSIVITKLIDNIQLFSKVLSKAITVSFIIFLVAYFSQIQFKSSY